MGRSQDADQVENEFLTKFPEGTGRLAYELWTDLAQLHLNWKNYRSLFGTSPERIDLLNWAASTFFGLLDTILLHDIILAIARLTSVSWDFASASTRKLTGDQELVPVRGAMG